MKNTFTLTISPSAWDAVQYHVEHLSNDPSETIEESREMTLALDDLLSRLYSRKRLKRPIEIHADLAFEVAEEIEHRLDIIEENRGSAVIDPAVYSSEAERRQIQKERRGLIEYLANLYPLRGTIEA